MYIKLPDTQLFLSRTGCHSHLNKLRAINSQGFGLVTSATLRKNTVSNYSNCQTKKNYRDCHLHSLCQKKNKPKRKQQNPKI